MFLLRHVRPGIARNADQAICYEMLLGANLLAKWTDGDISILASTSLISWDGHLIDEPSQYLDSVGNLNKIPRSARRMTVNFWRDQ